MLISLKSPQYYLINFNFDVINSLFRLVSNGKSFKSNFYDSNDLQLINRAYGYIFVQAENIWFFLRAAKIIFMVGKGSAAEWKYWPSWFDKKNLNYTGSNALEQSKLN